MLKNNIGMSGRAVWDCREYRAERSCTHMWEVPKESFCQRKELT